MATSSRRGKPLLQNMIERYFAIPEVQQWLMTREPRQANNISTLEKSFSYACMYYPPAIIPRGTHRHAYPQPFLDMGDVLLRHHVYDGIAVGTLYNQKEKHALSSVFDSVMKGSHYRLSGKPRTRNFAVDLRVNQLEIIEFAWMDDDSLIIACRRLVESTTEERRLVLTAELKFYQPKPPDRPPSSNCLLLRMRLDEPTVICDFCSVKGYQSCECPDTMRPEAPNVSPNDPVSDAIVTMRDPRDAPSGCFEGPIGSWENYTRKAFHFSQSGSFFITSKRRDPRGKMVSFRGPKYPVPYQFVCGHPRDTINLVKEYAKRTMLSDKQFNADTFLYGNGLSRGSRIGMIMDKDDDDIYLPRDMQQPNEYHPNIDTYSHDDNILPLEISNLVTDGTVPSQSTLSNDTLLSCDYGYASRWYGAAPSTVQDPSHCTDIGSLQNTRPNEESPSSILLDRDEGWMHKGSEVPEVPTHGLRHSNGITSNEWAETNPDMQTVIIDQLLSQPRQLSTSSQAVQRYMTVNKEGVPTCTQCSKSFPKRGNLARHIQTVHLKLKAFRCNECTKSFGYRAHLKRHLLSVHQRNKDIRGQARLDRQ